MVLAAGAGTRFAGAGDVNKLLAPWRGRPMVSWAIEAAVEAGVGPVWVVQGAVDLTSLVPEGVVTVWNPRWHEGQATSLQTAVSAAREAHLEAIVVGLADQPLVPASAWRAVAASEAPIAIATYDGKRRNPVRLSAAVWDLLPTAGDEGARAVSRRRPELVEEVPCEGDPTDIDTREDLARWS